MRPAVPSSRGRVRPGAGMWPTLIAAVAVLAYAGVSHAIWPQLIGCALVGMLASSFLELANETDIADGYRPAGLAGMILFCHTLLFLTALKSLMRKSGFHDVRFFDL